MASEAPPVEDPSHGDGFKRLFPEIEGVQTRYPLQTEVMIAMCNMAQYAFGAYESPTVSGFKETRHHRAYIQYLNSVAMDDIFEGFLKIQLKKATQLPRSWWWWGSKNDPYVTFCAGASTVRSETKSNDNQPVWNTTMYLPLRKRSIKVGDQDKLKISLFDDDKYTGWSVWKFISHFLDKDDIIGTADLDVEKLKKPGTHEFNLSVKDKTTVHFSTEYVSSEVVCKELGIEKGGPAWMHSVGKERTDIKLTPNCTWILHLGHLSAAPYAFFNSTFSDTQAWMHVYPQSKTVLLSFRGTEQSKLKDILMDLTAFPTDLKAACCHNYVLSPTPEFLDEDIRVHSGFLVAYAAIRSHLLQVLYDVTEWSEDWNICCIGHSLGGAVATLAAFEFKNRRNAQGKGPSVCMMSYGAPRVGNRAFANAYNGCLLHSYRVVDREDVIHLVPPGYVHTAKELLCCPTGEVLVEGMELSEFDHMILYSKNRESMDEFENSGSLEEIFAKYGFEFDEMAEKHVSKNYLGIIGGAVARFFENKPAIK